MKALRPHTHQAVRRPSDDLAGRPVPRRLRRSRRRHHHRPPRGRARTSTARSSGSRRWARRPACRSTRRRPAKALDYVLEDIDLVLVMSVNPGFGGQKFIASQLKKIEAIANRVAKEGLDVDDRGRRRHRRRDRAARRSAPAPPCWSPAPRRSAAGPDSLCRQHRARSRETDERDGSAAERDIVRKLARGSLSSRRLRQSQAAAQAHRGPARPCPRRPRSAATRLLAGRFTVRQRDASRSPTSISPRRRDGPLAEQLAGLLLAARPRRRRLARERRAPGRGGRRPLAARAWHRGPTTPGRRICGASASCSGPPTRRTSCRAATAAIARRCSTRSRAARGTSTPTPTRRRRASSGSPPGAASSPPGCWSRAACRASPAARPGSPARWPPPSSTTAG